MILVDTNVLSQLIRADGSARAVAWIDRNFDALFVPTIAVSELKFGAHKLADERQRELLVAAIEALIERFGRRFTSFDLVAAEVHGKLAAEAVRQGRTLSASDSVIAAMALARNCAVATRNIKTFHIRRSARDQSLGGLTAPGITPPLRPPAQSVWRLNPY